MSIVQPAEWSPHRAMWLGFPSHADLWADDLAPAQAEVAALARALAGPGGERVRLLVRGDEAVAAACGLLGEGSGVEIVRAQFGDVWLRDTGPIFVKRGEETVAAAFRFNGWGEKYVLDDDELVAEQIAAGAGSVRLEHDFVLEGGAVESDGLGTLLTTRQCLLNPNRNRGWTPARAEAALEEALGADKLVWLGQGLANDHTDGHVDNLARFVAPGVVACPVGVGRDDPNTDVYGEAARLLASAADARGVSIQVMRLPAPGRILDEDGEVAPASHMNFVIANGAVIMPVYEDRSSPLALEALGAMFPEREVIGLSSRALLTGGGSFHCITQPEPA